MHYIITLSEDGSKFTFKQPVHSLENDAIYAHPALVAMMNARNHKACLNALVVFAHNFLFKNIANDYYNSKVYCLKSHGGSDKITAVLMHQNVPHNLRHMAMPGMLHSDSLESMIEYVNSKIKEQSP